MPNQHTRSLVDKLTLACDLRAIVFRINSRGCELQAPDEEPVSFQRLQDAWGYYRTNLASIPPQKYQARRN